MKRDTFNFNVKADLKNSGIEIHEILKLNNDYYHRDAKLVFDKVDDEGKVNFIFITSSCRNEEEAALADQDLQIMSSKVKTRKIGFAI